MLCCVSVLYEVLWRVWLTSSCGTQVAGKDGGSCIGDSSWCESSICSGITEVDDLSSVSGNSKKERGGTYSGIAEAAENEQREELSEGLHVGEMLS